MTVAAAKQFALSVCGAAGIAAALVSAVLIWAVVTSPDRLAMAMSEGNAEELLALVVQRIVSMWRGLLHLL